MQQRAQFRENAVGFRVGRGCSSHEDWLQSWPQTLSREDWMT